MATDAKLVKQLRDLTGGAFKDCIAALEESAGDMDKATAWLRKRGIEKAGEKADRETKQGRIGVYVHGAEKGAAMPAGKGAAMVDLRCETDFVAKNPEFDELLRDICLQVYALQPTWISRADVPANILAEEKERFAAEVKGKPAEIIEKIVQGKLDKNFYAAKCLLEQPFVKDPDGKTKIEDLIKAKIGKFKENITVRRFCRYEIAG
ncbi:MAG: elongation factor Ts [Planctomycetes bacterium]|nr:elongation factor Ts [Planctomycetota bacterium]